MEGPPATRLMKEKVGPTRWVIDVMIAMKARTTMRPEGIWTRSGILDLTRGLLVFRWVVSLVRWWFSEGRWVWDFIFDGL